MALPKKEKSNFMNEGGKVKTAKKPAAKKPATKKSSPKKGCK